MKLTDDMLPLLWGVTIGPDGTIIAREVVGGKTSPLIRALDLFWIEAAWNLDRFDVTPQLCLIQDGLGRPGAVPPGLDYREAIRSSTTAARRRMLNTVRRYIPDEAMAACLSIPLDKLRQIIAEVYPEEAHEGGDG